MTTEEFVARLHGIKATSKGYTSLCPGHADRRNPNLVVTPVEDRILVFCRAGCRTPDILLSIGLGFPDLFFDNNKIRQTSSCHSQRQLEPLPRFIWNWRRQCSELERLIQEKREHAEHIHASTYGLDINALTDSELDDVMSWVTQAYNWLDRCNRLDETLYLLQQDFRAEEQAKYKRIMIRKMVTA